MLAANGFIMSEQSVDSVGRNQCLQCARWLLVGIPLAIAMGCCGAFFLWALEMVAGWRQAQSFFIYGLPLAGLLVYGLYQGFGPDLAAGNQRILQAVENPEVQVPLRLMPLILVTTLITHLFGGSAGREGTAIQMGGSLAGAWGRWLGFDAVARRALLLAGMATGFAAVFGTPLTGAVFAFEILRSRLFRWDYALLCVLLAWLADAVCHLFPIQHITYSLRPFTEALASVGGLQWSLGFKFALAALAFGLVARGFIAAAQALKSGAHKWIQPAWIVPIIGGLLVLLISYGLGTRDYLGLGVWSADPEVITICSAFHQGGADTYSWLWKAVLTVVTLSLGFKGGEVTPLFFIGATLGNSLAISLGLPVDWLAGLGMVAVFAAATHAPLACCVLSGELFGWGNLVCFIPIVYLAHYCSGPINIYQKQRSVNWLEAKLKTCCSPRR